MLSTFYDCSLKEFRDMDVSDFINNMENRANDCLVYPTDSEIKSWKSNRDALLALFKNAKLPDDVHLAFELQMPISGGRIDCALFGEEKEGERNMVHIELKQWSNKNVNAYYDKSFSVVVDGYGSGTKYTSHPSAQVAGYHNCILNYVKAFKKNNIKLSGFAYCYNYYSNKRPIELLDQSYDVIRKQYPLYCADQESNFATVLENLLCGGKGKHIFDGIVNSEIGQTERLYDVAAHMLDNTNGGKVFELVSDQIDAFNTIVGAVNNTPVDKKTVIIVKGGPGTGKSVIAIRLLAELYAQGFKNVYYATRSTSLKNEWQGILNGIGVYGKGSAGDLIKSTYDFRPYFYDFKENGGDVLIVDEAHRISEKSGDQTDSSRSKYQYTSNLTQIMAMLYTSRVCVFFIDDKQSIKNTEIGLSSEIRKAAEEYKTRIEKENNDFASIRIPEIDREIKSENAKLCKAANSGSLDEIKEIDKTIRRLEREKNLRAVTPNIKDEDVEIIEFELKDQFRCNGSNNYLSWVDSMIYEDGKEKLDTTSYEFEVFDTPQELVEKIRSLDDYARYLDEQKKKLGDNFTYRQFHEETANMSFETSARVVAGWCWEWARNKIQKDGDLLHEVHLPQYGFEMPWETRKKPQNDFKYKYAKDADSWCNQKEGVNQVGCIHSIQGWETDYVGVIIGPDLIYDKKNGLLYNPKMENSAVEHRELTGQASQRNNQLIRNIYRVLLTRGKKGCFVFASDPKVRDYIKKCINGNIRGCNEF